jgi:hypothetical protein
LDLPDMNQIGLLEQQEELRRLSQQIHFLNGKAPGSSQAQKGLFPLTAPSAQTAQTVAARSGVGSPEPGGSKRERNHV